jgi:hypothetical protein
VKTSPDEKCPNCPDEFVEPYARITLRRLQLSVNLGSIILGLTAQAVILLIYGNYTAAISYCIWAALPAYLVLRYVLELRDVFHYWNNPYFRPALALAAISIGVIGSENSYYFDLVGWIFAPRVFLVTGGLQLNSWLLFLVSALIFFVFLVVRYYLNLKIPSVKTRILRALKDTPEGYTVSKWRDLLDPSHTCTDLTEEEITNTLRELAYQGKITIRLDSRQATPQYASVL